MFELFDMPEWRERAAAAAALRKEKERWSRQSWAFADIDMRNGEPIASGEPVILSTSAWMRRGMTAHKASTSDLPHCVPCASCERPTRPSKEGEHGRKRVFCCERCRRAWRAGARRQERSDAQDGRALVKCEACGVDFRPSRSDAKCCSNKCRQAAFRGRRNG